MNLEITKVLAPANEDGQMDDRFQEDQQWIVEQIGPEVIDALRDFKKKTTDLENQYEIEEQVEKTFGYYTRPINMKVAPLRSSIMNDI